MPSCGPSIRPGLAPPAPPPVRSSPASVVTLRPATSTLRTCRTKAGGRGWPRGEVRETTVRRAGRRDGRRCGVQGAAKGGAHPPTPSVPCCSLGHVDHRAVRRRRAAPRNHEDRTLIWEGQGRR
eukprot:scaffold130112_cov60-Phaeocystis_antarctica.AAC.3